MSRQKIEMKHLDILRSPYTKARVRIWTLADFLEDPMHHFQVILDEIGPRSNRRLTEVPTMVDLKGFGRFLQNLKNQGMKPVLMGDFPVTPNSDIQKPDPQKPYLVR